MKISFSGLLKVQAIYEAIYLCLSYCLKCEEKQTVKSHLSQRQKNLKECFYETLKQETSGLLTSLLGDKSTFERIGLLDSIIYRYKMNKIINKFLLTGDKFTPEMCLGQPRFTYSACRPFIKKKQRRKKF